MSIRLRVTLFGIGVVTGLLAIFCVAVFLLLAAGAGTSQDNALAERAAQAVTALNATPAAGLSAGPGSAGPVAAGGVDPRLSSDVFVVVLDRQGAVVSSTGGVDGAAPAIPREMLNAAAGGPARATLAAAPGVPIRVAVRAWTGGFVAAAQTTRRVQEDRRSIFVLVAVYAFFGFWGGAGAIWIVSGRALRPLRELTVLVDEIGRSQDLGRRLPVPISARDDVGRLTGSFNAMMVRLQEAYARLARALAAQQRFTADASHELRTPLTTIRNNAAFLQRHPDAAADDREAAVRDIAGQSERMSRLVDSLLALARADAGQRSAAAPVDLGALAEDVCRQARGLHPERDISCAVTPTPRVLGDADALAQLLWILVDNAVKYTEAGGHVWVVVTQRGDRAQLHVSDDGPGIPAGAERRIFQRFYRADDARSGTGAGLGLSIADWIVRSHGGTMIAANNARGGASFVAELSSAP